MMERLLRAKDVTELTALSRTAMDRLVNAGEFPIPVKVGPRRYAWVESEVQKWIADQMEQRI